MIIIKFISIKVQLDGQRCFLRRDLLLRLILNGTMKCSNLMSYEIHQMSFNPDYKEIIFAIIRQLDHCDYLPDC